MSRVGILAAFLATVIVGLAIGVYIYSNAPTDRLEFVYFARGSQLSIEGAGTVEQDLKSHPDSFGDRIELLAFYSFKATLHHAELTAADLANRREHIFWVIDHEPESDFAGSLEAAFDGDNCDPDGVQRAKQLWSEHVQQEPTDARILYNAGRFSSWVDNWRQSEELLERAYAIAPGNHDIASHLAELYLRDARHSMTAEQASAMAIKSLRAYEQALKDAHNSRERLNDFPEAAQAAFGAGDYERAATLSREGLTLAEQAEYRENGDDAVHYGNIVLGRLAVRQGNIADASAHLLKAATIKGNPHLDTFGPNMMLAKELLEKGERKSVLSYFDLCAKFWTNDSGKLSQWRSLVLSGANPDFGDNLRY